MTSGVIKATTTALGLGVLPAFPVSFEIFAMYVVFYLAGLLSGMLLVEFRIWRDAKKQKTKSKN